MSALARSTAIAASLALGTQLIAQGTTPIATQFDKLHFRSIGPAIMSGRIADLAVYEKTRRSGTSAPRTAACGRRRATAPS